MVALSVCLAVRYESRPWVREAMPKAHSLARTVSPAAAIADPDLNQISAEGGGRREEGRKGAHNIRSDPMTLGERVVFAEAFRKVLDCGEFFLPWGQSQITEAFGEKRKRRKFTHEGERGRREGEG